MFLVALGGALNRLAIAADGGVMAASPSGLAGSSLSWAGVVGRDGIEPPTLRFSAGCDSSGTVRHDSSESPLP